MAEWKQIITSGSNTHLNNITASSGISASGLLFFSSSETTNNSYKFLVQDLDSGRIYHTASAGGGSSVATGITLGASTEGNNNFTSNTTVQSAINDIDTILGLLAPAKPSNLSAVNLDWYPNNNNVYSARKTDGTLVDDIIKDTINPQFQADDFYNGDSGDLTAQLDNATDGDYDVLATITLTTADQDGSVSNGILTIISDDDPYVNQTGKSGFYKQLTARISLTGLTANSVGDYTRHKVKLDHSETGNAIKEFTVDSDPATSVTNLNYSYNETNNFHYQSGIKYLGLGDIISTFYDVTISSNANFINSDRETSDVNDSPNCLFNKKHTRTTWSPGTTYNVTHSSDVFDNVFNLGNVQLQGRNYKASSNNANAIDDTITISNLLVDSTTENETTPTSGVTRVKSGNGLYPSFGNSTGDFSGTFSRSTSLTAANEYELQFSSRSYHWPPSTNYSTGYTPAGPDYSSISGDGNNDSLRYVTFNLGTITNAGTVTLTFKNCNGFDNALIQTEDNFKLHLIVVNGGTAVTGWIDGNAQFSGAGNTVDRDGIGGIAPEGNSSGGNGHDFVRVITFGDVVRSGTVYVRVGWDSGAGTNVLSNSTRKFEYITKS